MTDTDTSNEPERWEPTAPNDADAAADAAPKRSNRNRRIAVVGGAAALIGLGAIAAPVLAQTITGHDREDAERQQFEHELAERLGVPQSKVDDALTAMQGDRLAHRIDELQQSGALSADQATAIKAKLASGDLKGAFGDLRGAMMAKELDALVAKGTITKVQADQIATLVASGAPVGLRMPPPGASGDEQPQHVESAAHQRRQVQELQQHGVLTADQAKGITELIDAGKTAEAETAIHAAMDAGMLARLVQDGAITQAQADQIAALQQAGVPIGIGGPGMGGPGGHHGPDMDGDHHGMDMDGDHGMGGIDGEHEQDGGSQSGQYQPQSYDGAGNA